MSGHEEGYVGPAELLQNGPSPAVTVTVTLRGMFQPIDGHYHWYGRLQAHERLEDSSGASVVLRTPEGEARGRLSDLDPWGRHRISGTGRPPFALEA